MAEFLREAKTPAKHEPVGVIATIGSEGVSVRSRNVRANTGFTENVRFRVATALVLVGLAVGCTQRRDPLVEAAEDFRDQAYQAVERDEERKRRLNSLTLGMNQEKVLEQAGPPDSRNAGESVDGGTREVWLYQGTVGRRLGRLVFEDGRLTSVSVP